MTDHRSGLLSLRKQPQQIRSADLVAAILDAAVQVLTKEGARRFTTARVAERAGVSIGSLYQYFPNKAAILFRLQNDEWRRTAAMLRAILEDGDRPALVRLRALVQAFVRSECEEAAIRTALGDAAPLYRDAPETRDARSSGRATVEVFMREVLPETPDVARAVAGDLVGATLSALGKHVSRTPRTDAEIEAYGEAIADMLCAYLLRLREAPATGGPPPLGVAPL